MRACCPSRRTARAPRPSADEYYHSRVLYDSTICKYEVRSTKYEVRHTEYIIGRRQRDSATARQPDAVGDKERRLVGGWDGERHAESEATASWSLAMAGGCRGVVQGSAAGLTFDPTTYNFSRVTHSLPVRMWYTGASFLFFLRRRQPHAYPRGLPHTSMVQRSRALCSSRANAWGGLHQS